MPREYAYDIMPEIQARYAVRSFTAEPVDRDALLPLLEAARYAPSCYNEQPWRFILGDTPQTHEKLAQSLVAGNAWAKEAPVLILALCTKNFVYDGRVNPYAQFDTGAAVGFLQLEAVRRGYAVHCMAGFRQEQLRETFAIPADLDIITMIALGKPADLNTLPPERRKKEEPGTRNPLESIILSV